MLSAAVLLVAATIAAGRPQGFPTSIAQPYGGAEVRGDAIGRVPSNVTLPVALRPVVARMLQNSVTFRRQCSRIGRTPALVVTLQYLGIDRSLSVGGATTEVTRRSDGRIEAIVRLATFDNPVELIAHEFEHVLEQIDGVDLPAMATRPATGVRRVRAGGHFETDRAIVMGRLVADEVRRARR